MACKGHALERVQKKAVNMVSGLKGSTYEEKLEEIGMLTLQERIHQAEMVQVFKILHGYDKVDKNQWFRLAGEKGVHTRLATGVLNLGKPRCNTDMRTNFFSVGVIERWNSLPDHIKKEKNAGQFKM